MAVEVADSESDDDLGALMREVKQSEDSGAEADAMVVSSGEEDEVSDGDSNVRELRAERAANVEPLNIVAAMDVEGSDAESSEYESSDEEGEAEPSAAVGFNWGLDAGQPASGVEKMDVSDSGEYSDSDDGVIDEADLVEEEDAQTRNQKRRDKRYAHQAAISKCWKQLWRAGGKRRPMRHSHAISRMAL